MKLHKTIFIMLSDQYLMYEGKTVIFETMEEAEECLAICDKNAVIKESIFFCDEKITWKEIRKEVLELEDEE